MREFGLCCVFGLAMSLVAGSSPALAGPPDDKKREPLVERAGEQASRGIIEEALETLDKPENQARLGRILDSEYTRDAVRDLGASLVLGVYDGVHSARRLRSKAKDDIAASFSHSMDQRISPAIVRLARSLVDAALDEALTEGHINRVERLGEQATHAAVRGLSTGVEQDLGPALAATIDRDLGPALAIVLERDLMPAMARGLESPEMQRAVSALAHSIASEFVTGAGEAIDTGSEKGGLKLFGNKVALGYAIALFVAFALGTAAIVLTVILVRNTRRLRNQSKEATGREAALMHIIDSLKTKNPELEADVERLLEEQLKEKD